MIRFRPFALLLAALSSAALTSCLDNTPSDSPQSSNRALHSPQEKQLIVRCATSCTSIADFVTHAGGAVTIRYSNVQALAITLPASQLSALEQRSDVKAISKDVITNSPKPIQPLRISATDVRAVNSIAQDLPNVIAALPANYNFNHALTGIESLHTKGQFGEGIVVAVIDTGCANNPEKVASLAGSIIGGENLVALADEPSATSTLNDPHGTWAATLIAGHGAIVLDSTSKLISAIKSYAPESVQTVNDTQSSVALIGTAPKASLYCLKVAGATEDGFPSSRVIAAMDRVLTLKRNFEAGLATTPVSGDGSEDNPFVYQALNIQVVNLSLGGPTLYAAQEVEDILTLDMLKNGIVVTVSAGNEGPAAMTGASPGTGLGALTVGAASEAKNERVLRELQLAPDLGLGQGLIFRPTSHLQTADFSSRGPTADGRLDPDVIANGIASLVQSASGGIALVSGTSFSSPSTAGAAALLRKEAVTATATQIRNALINAANPELFGDNSSPIERGAGFINVPNALKLLQADGMDNRLPSFPESTSNVRKNIEQLGFEVLQFDEDSDLSREVNLVPGEVSHFFIASSKKTRNLRIRISDFEPELPQDQQNQLFGDDLIVTVVDAPTSYNHTRLFEFVNDSRTFDIPDPQEGIVRLAVMGDWTNAGAISAKITLEESNADVRPATFRGKLKDEDIDQFAITVKKDTEQLQFHLSWDANWGRYPSHDLDLILINPKGEFIFDGATLDSPERVNIINPMPGKWTLLVEGFLLHGFEDSYRLNVRVEED